jgi:RNA polymerase-binding transcription factor DksA
MKARQISEEQRRNDALSRMLHDRRAEIEGRMRSLREVIPAQDAGVKDAEEQSMEDFVRDMDVALIVMESETLRRIDEALQRVEEGTYGICADCEGTIAEARLQALPFATLCRDCQEREESDSGARAGGRRPVFDEPPSKQEQALARQRAALQGDPLIQRTMRLARSRV